MEKKLELTFVFEKDEEEGGFTGICLELNVASEGGTLEEAEENLLDAVRLYLTHAFESGRFEQLVPRPVPDYVRSRLKKSRNTNTVRSKYNLPDHFNLNDFGPGSGRQLLHV